MPLTNGTSLTPSTRSGVGSMASFVQHPPRRARQQQRPAAFEPRQQVRATGLAEVRRGGIVALVKPDHVELLRGAEAMIGIPPASLRRRPQPRHFGDVRADANAAHCAAAELWAARDRRTQRQPINPKRSLGNHGPP